MSGSVAPRNVDDGVPVGDAGIEFGLVVESLDRHYDTVTEPEGLFCMFYSSSKSRAAKTTFLWPGRVVMLSTIPPRHVQSIPAACSTNIGEQKVPYERPASRMMAELTACYISGSALPYPLHTYLFLPKSPLRKVFVLVVFSSCRQPFTCNHPLTRISPVIFSCDYSPTYLQASELSNPLPSYLIIPSSRTSSVATAAYTLLGVDGARVLVEGKSGVGKTALLSHLLRVGGPTMDECAPRNGLAAPSTTCLLLSTLRMVAEVASVKP